MTSPLLALFTRSLREDARSKGTFWTRIGLGVFILLILVGTASTGSWVGAPGRNFFIGIVILQAIAITFVGLSYFASAITEEKEEETLGLLRMTNLSPLSILLGKSTSRLCGALLLLVAQFPFTVIAVTLGGISLGQIAATYCTLGAYVFLLCNVALLGSVIARRTPGAAVFSVAVLGLLFSTGPLLRVLHYRLVKLGINSRLEEVGITLWQNTPIARLFEILGTGFAGSPAGWQVLSNLAVGVGCFLVAWLVFERCCDQTTVEAVASGPLPRPAVGVRLGRPPRPTADALTWKDFHFLHGGRMGRIVRILGYGGLLTVAFSDWQNSSGSFGIQSGVVSILSFIFSIDVAAMAARIFRHELRDHTFSALGMLPCSVRQLAYRKWRTCLIAAAPGALCLVGGNLLFLTSLRASGNPGEMWMMMLGQAISGWINLFLLAYVVAWLSLSMTRGALPVGYVATQAFKMLVSILSLALIGVLGYLGSGGFAIGNGSVYLTINFLVGCLVSLVTIHFLHRAILRRLEVLVGES